MQELRERTPEQQTARPSNDEPSSLSAIMSSQAAPQSSFVDHDYSLVQQEDVLSTSLTGLELLQRGLTVDGDQPPDASHLSSWSSSGANTYDAVATEQQAPPQEDSLDNNNMSPLPDDEEDDDGDDDSPVFDLDME